VNVSGPNAHGLAPIIHEKSAEGSRSIFRNSFVTLLTIQPLIVTCGRSLRVFDNGSTTKRRVSPPGDDYGSCWWRSVQLMRAMRL
jgi:hypothetical protein